MFIAPEMIDPANSTYDGMLQHWLLYVMHHRSGCLRVDELVRFVLCVFYSMLMISSLVICALLENFSSLSIRYILYVLVAFVDLCVSMFDDRVLENLHFQAKSISGELVALDSSFSKSRNNAKRRSGVLW